MKYSLSGVHAEHEQDPDAVEIPELDALLADLDSVLKKHDVQFSVEGGWDGDSPRLVLERYEDTCPVDLARHLDEASADIPWIARARREWQHKVRERAAAWKAQQRALEEQKASMVVSAEAKLLRDGLTIGGEKYRLVKVRE